MTPPGTSTKAAPAAPAAASVNDETAPVEVVVSGKSTEFSSRLLAVLVFAIAGLVTVIGSSSDVGTFGLLGTCPMTAANVSSRFVVVDEPPVLDVPVVGAVVRDGPDAAGCAVVDSFFSDPPRLPAAGSMPFLVGTSTVDMIGGFVSTAFVSIVVFGFTCMISGGSSTGCSVVRILFHQATVRTLQHDLLSVRGDDVGRIATTGRRQCHQALLVKYDVLPVLGVEQEALLRTIRHDGGPTSVAVPFHRHVRSIADRDTAGQNHFRLVNDVFRGLVLVRSLLLLLLVLLVLLLVLLLLLGRMLLMLFGQCNELIRGVEVKQFVVDRHEALIAYRAQVEEVSWAAKIFRRYGNQLGGFLYTCRTSGRCNCRHGGTGNDTGAAATASSISADESLTPTVGVDDSCTDESAAAAITTLLPDEATSATGITRCPGPFWGDSFSIRDFLGLLPDDDDDTLAVSLSSGTGKTGAVATTTGDETTVPP
uniref:Uncharacterized protein n=1 Tax=Anopheles farauti TaxID=69004 RepID=A0A182QA07_9DIPT